MLFKARRVKTDKRDELSIGARTHLTDDSLAAVMRAHRGGKLSRKQVTLLEQKVMADPSDVKSRVSLLGYYHKSSILSWSGFFSSVFLGASIHQRRYVDLVTWFVEHRPQCIEAGLPEMYPPLGFDEPVSKHLKELWEKQIAKFPTNVIVLCNAASFFHHIDKVVSAELLRSAQELDPDNPYIAGRLSQLYTLESQRSPELLAGALSQKGSTTRKEFPHQSIRPWKSRTLGIRHP